MTPDYSRKLLAEMLGTALLLAIVVGSGIMGARLAEGNIAIALLANSLATGAGLSVLILILGPISGAHFNPAVTTLFLIRGDIGTPLAACYMIAQILGAAAGVMLAHAMFDLSLLEFGRTPRAGAGQAIGELTATTALLITIIGCIRWRPEATAYAVGLIITAGYWFTSSTSFANPAVTFARMFTDSFAGIRPVDAPLFIAAQFVAVILAILIAKILYPRAAPAG